MIKHKNVLAIIITFCNSTNNNVNLFFSQQAIFEISRQARNDIVSVMLSVVQRSRNISDFCLLNKINTNIVFFSLTQ